MTVCLSIVIPFYRDNDRVHDCLASIETAWCSAPPDAMRPDIIVVDDHSPVPFEPKNRDLPLCCHRFEKNRGVGAARNAGARLSRGSHILFLDSDVRLTPDFFQHLFRHLSENKGPIIQGPTSVTPANRPATLFHHYMAQAWHYYQTRNWSISLFTQCVVFERNFFFELGGFSESYARSGGEEFELGLRLARKAPSSIVYDPMLVHEHYSDDLVKRMKKAYLRSRYIRPIALSMPNLPFRFTAQSLLRSCYALLLNLSLVLTLVSPFKGVPVYSLGFVLFYLCDDSFSRHIRKNHSLGLSLLSVIYRQLEYSFINLGMLAALFTGGIDD